MSKAETMIAIVKLCRYVWRRKQHVHGKLDEARKKLGLQKIFNNLNVKRSLLNRTSSHFPCSRFDLHANINISRGHERCMCMRGKVNPIKLTSCI